MFLSRERQRYAFVSVSRVPNVAQQDMLLRVKNVGSATAAVEAERGTGRCAAPDLARTSGTMRAVTIIRGASTPICATKESHRSHPASWATPTIS